MASEVSGAETVPVNYGPETPARSADEFYVDTERMEVWIGDRQLPINQTLLLKLIAYLYENRHRVCSETEIGNHLWPPEPAGIAQFEPNSVYQLIYRLRQEVEPLPRRARYIVSVRGLGYRLHLRPSDNA
jgi:DNA-binding response OmpR family regulator